MIPSHKRARPRWNKEATPISPGEVTLQRYLNDSLSLTCPPFRTGRITVAPESHIRVETLRVV